MSKGIVAVVTKTYPIVGADRIHVAVVLGENVIVSKDIKEGYVGILFPEGTQLSEEFCYQNNLYRVSNENKDNTKTGFFEASRRVRAQPFKSVKSSAYFTSLDSVQYTFDGKEIARKWTLGETFDELHGHKICNKYISQATRDAIAKAGNKSKQPKKDYAPYFEKHVDSAQFKHAAGMIAKGALIHIHAKVHGTSHRSGITLANVTLPRWKELVNKIIPEFFPTKKWEHVVGTRNVVLSSPDKDGFHGSEAFRFDVAESLKPYLKNGMTVYGEIAGYANSKPIMAVHSAKATKDKAFQKKYDENIVYKYGCAEHEYRFHVYRVTQLDMNGVNVDYTQAQLEQFCADYGFIPPLNVCEPFIYDGDVEALTKKVEFLTERPDVVSEDYIDPSHNGEGVILRIDTGKANPYFLKNKAFHFKTMEGLCEAVDTEDVEAA